MPPLRLDIFLWNLEPFRREKGNLYLYYCLSSVTWVARLTAASPAVGPVQALVRRDLSSIGNLDFTFLTPNAIFLDTIAMIFGSQFQTVIDRLMA